MPHDGTDIVLRPTLPRVYYNPTVLKFQRSLNFLTAINEISQGITVEKVTSRLHIQQEAHLLLK